MNLCVLNPVGEHYVEGEDPNSKEPGDVRHWVALYGEMVDFKTQLLQRISGQLPHMSRAARRALDRDVKLLQTQLSRYRRRLQFWSKREAGLAGLELDDSSLALIHGSRRATLTSREFEVISVLLSRPGEPFEPDALLSTPSEHHPEVTSETVEVIIGQLGEKLRDLGVPCEIVLVPDRGYKAVFRQ